MEKCSRQSFALTNVDFYLRCLYLDLYYMCVTEASKHYEMIPISAFEPRECLGLSEHIRPAAMTLSHNSVWSSEHITWLNMVCTDCTVITFGT